MTVKILQTYENNSMSLSCSGTMRVEDDFITEVRFSGYPRTSGDSWVRFYQRDTGAYIGPEAVEITLSYNGKNNVVSTMKELKS